MMLRNFQLLAILSFIVLAACATTPPKDKPEPGPEPTDGPTIGGIKHDAKTAEQFIRRYEQLRVGLVNYIEPRNVKLNGHELSGDGVVFRLNLTGDNGAFHKAAVDLAVELMEKNGWDEVQLQEENSAVGHLASVKFESLGMPVDAHPGAHMPVRVVLVGDATDISGGYMYPTPIRNSAGRTVAYFRGGYLPHIPEPGEPWRDSEGKELPPGTLPLLEKRETAGRIGYILREGFQITSSASADDLIADTIELPLSRDIIDEATGQVKETIYPLSVELVPEVVKELDKELAAANIPCRVRADGPHKIIVTPTGVREMSLRQIQDAIENVKVTIRPRSNVIIMFDEELYRVAIYGPGAKRFLISSLNLVIDPFSENAVDRETGRPVKPYPLPFRVRCEVVKRAERGTSGLYGVPTPGNPDPDGNKGEVRLAWSLRNDAGNVISEGDETLPSTDISDILRHLWVRGMGPREVLGFCVRAKEAFALAADLGFNYRKVDLAKLAAGNPGDG
ncbi:MAG: flagellar basal body P-ring protein FlgI [Planctomycetes bacterium]|nr:flagellar basal body P-ring protein FlgI [Planctomycetota bacterium]